jgi:hypothetical protein
MVYYPINCEKWYLEIYSVPLQIIQKHQDVSLYLKSPKYEKCLVKKEQMLNAIFKPLFSEIFLFKSWYPHVFIWVDRVEYFIDWLKKKLWLNIQQTMEYLGTLTDDEIRWLMVKKSWKHLLIYWREPDNVKKIANELMKKKMKLGENLDKVSDKVYKDLMAKNFIQKYVKSNFSWIFSLPLLNLVVLPERWDKSARKIVNSENFYFSVFSENPWILICVLSCRWIKPLTFHISNYFDDFIRIRERLEKLIPSPETIDEIPILNLVWRTKILKNDLSIKFIKRDDYLVKNSDGSYEDYVWSISVGWICNWKEIKNSSSEFLNTWRDIVTNIYKSIMECLTSERYIDVNQILWIKLYDKIDFVSVLDVFRSEKIENYLWVEMKTYFKYLVDKRTNMTNQVYEIYLNKYKKWNWFIESNLVLKK